MHSVGCISLASCAPNCGLPLHLLTLSQRTIAANQICHKATYSRAGAVKMVPEATKEHLTKVDGAASFPVTSTEATRAVITERQAAISQQKSVNKPCDSKLNEAMETSSATWRQQIFGKRSSRATHERLWHERACSAHTLQVAISHAKDAPPALLQHAKRKTKQKKTRLLAIIKHSPKARERFNRCHRRMKKSPLHVIQNNETR